ncbi:hypothetical protein Tco_1082737 [Tanacetum coccineum]|uniref:Uncharacterized protein n=1 Tax=Tanacetum coccineum TaxID=301880 RepID=A0ABQ5I3E7_9ASTR
MVEANPYPISQGSMELQERSRVYMGTRRSIPKEIPAFVLKDRAVIKCCVLSLEDKAQLMRGDYNTSYFRRSIGTYGAKDAIGLRLTQGDNVEGEEQDEEEDVNELYRDVNINLERRDTEMTNALQTNVQGTQVIEDTHVIITAVTSEAQQQSSFVSSGFISIMLNPNLDTCIDSILNLNTESTSLVDVPVTMDVEMPPSSVTTLPPPPIPLVQPQQQKPVPTPAIVPIKQTNLFAEAVSSIPSIVDKYLANQMNEVVKAAVQL